MADLVSLPFLFLSIFIGATVILFIFLYGIVKKANSDGKSQDQCDVTDVEEKKKKDPFLNNKRIKSKKDIKVQFSHQWLVCTLKGHCSPILDFDVSPNGKYVASCDQDRVILIWSIKEFESKDRRSIRANVELDHATQVRWSPDNKALIMSLFQTNKLRVMKMGKKPDGSMGNFETALDFPQIHDKEIVSVGIASSGNFIMSSTVGTQIKIWNLRGEVLTTIDNHQMTTSHTITSNCGRFVGSSGFTSDVKVWEIEFDKGGNFKAVNRAWELKGHSAGIHHFSFNQDSSKMASISKDGTWKLWNTQIEYKKGQEPYLISTGKYNHKTEGRILICLSPDGSTVAVSTHYNITLYNAVTTENCMEFENPHSCPIVKLAFTISGRYLLSVGGKQMHVYHNVVGLKISIEELEELLKKATNKAQKERIKEQIKSAINNIEAIENAVS